MIGFARVEPLSRRIGPRDAPGEIEQIGSAGIFQQPMQARLGLKQAGEAQPRRYHHDAETERDAQHMRDRAAEAEIGGRGRDHDDVGSRRQAHGGSEQDQWSQQDALAHLETPSPCQGWLAAGSTPASSGAITSEVVTMGDIHPSGA